MSVVDVRLLGLLALGVAACDPGPTPEMRARSASDSATTMRYATPRDTSALPQSSPTEDAPTSRKDKFDKH